MKYKINRNPSPLTDTDLSAARDFDSLLSKYRAVKLPFYRSTSFMAASAAIVTIITAALITYFSSQTGTAPPPPASFIAPPLAQINVPATDYTVSADSASELVHTTGSKIHIPTGAFRDAAGNLVTGKVTLKYREFHDQQDIFISGIPMTYDSAGKQYVFESAGMFEITAAQNGQPLKTNTDKPITIDMVSSSKDPRFNSYYLDTAAKKWITIPQPSMPNSMIPVAVSSKSDSSIESPEVKAAIQKLEQQVKAAAQAVKSIEQEKPAPPRKADKDKVTFHVEVDSAEFPEIAMYKGVKFQIKNDTLFDKNAAKTEWHDVKLKKLNGIDYEVIFTRGIRVLRLVGTPVISDRDLPAAQRMYDSKYAQYQAKLSARLAAEEKAKQEMNALMEKRRAEAEKIRREYESTLTQSELIYRSFSINGFGIHNSDCTIAWPSEVEVEARFMDQDGHPLSLNGLYLIDTKYNAVFNYQISDARYSHFKYDRTTRNVLWAVTADGKLAVVSKDDFAAQCNQNGKANFRFKVIDRTFKTSEDLKEYLKL